MVSRSNKIGWKIGARDKARFWEDSWVGSNNLKTVFPKLYSISLDLRQEVGEVGGGKNENGSGV